LADLASGGGIAADAQGNIYALVANGTFETTLDASGFRSNHDYGNAFVKVSTTGSTLQVADYFDMLNTVSESGADVDLGSGGAMLLPDLIDGPGTTVHLAVRAGKDGNIYVVDRTHMGKFSPSSNNVYQELPGAVSNGVFGVPAYFNNMVYYCDVGAHGRVLHVSWSPAQRICEWSFQWYRQGQRKNGRSRPARVRSRRSDSGALKQQPGPSGRDHIGSGNKFITPMIAGGKVFAAMTNSVAVFGLLP
jgi:hypothetical protein